MLGEIWKDIKAYEGLYQVSNYGRVRSLDRMIWNKRNKSFYKAKGIILKGKRLKTNYIEVMLYDKQNNKREFLIHRIVAEAFIPNPDNKPQVNHKNGVKHDNRDSNLEWVTRKENVNHALKKGLIKVGSKSTSSKLTEEQVIEIRALFGTKKYSFSELGRMFNVDGAGIGRIIKGQTWKHLPIIDYDFDIDSLERKRRQRKLILTQEQINEAASMVDSGISKRKVAEHFGVTHTTINRFLKERVPK
ncbi:HNH endonuclease [Bacillus sporothermodurans]|uniref:NUMOD4 domain-containing protein n=1 Tax=Heyndrickxia sporothermodurans TaxID=46224 RepID=UPI000D43C6AC|nr:NUMOD4 domain-containing protein [Heyndrickxia sporothermodurans]MBL5768239.1 HNH endonuclease [Heyndrickxia sporothermodurans]MBL5771018.1 HNH endonuclease [Heyndrickxia sporothermodurans]MBL5774686.1 HNH endonuclease [Heyndrickxia sporothermodurans]MBL5778120.1 HNH endonuclease [Heyndrickxia sporothermodurans]MBL5785393.1 HNH endonuclease [Heyndrickxia sporothermodurans]